ncbi:MAG: TonB-dependent receptor plug domain-containing protein [Bacteroidales bacterium]|jgi:outer membrane cobalamin receptor|nr:TonB-dependent receptor plug domain-containing protein [Bacteroidales bacterium]
MRRSHFIIAFLATLNGFVAGVFARDIDTVRVHEIQEVTVTADRIRREIIPVQRLEGKLLERLSSHSVADALRYFSGVQLKDYGGIGGLKTVNIRSMGSQHAGVFYDGVEIGNAQNGVVDLGRYSLDNMEAVSLYNGQKSSIFQPAKDFASASSIYLTTRVPRFAEGKNDHIKITFKTGSFDLIDPSLLWEHRISPNIQSSLNAVYTNSSGKYKFRYKVNNPRDARGGYDTTAVRKNGDIEIFRIEYALFGKISGGEWKTRLYYYDSERGYPGAVVKEEPGRMKHEDRQKDRNFFSQSSLKKRISENCFTQLTGKYAYDYIYYESDTLIQKLRNKYTIHDVYLSSANMFGILPFWSVNVSADYRWNGMDSNIPMFNYPQRHTGWVVAATSFHWPRLNVQASLLGTFVHESAKEEIGVRRDWKRYTPTILASWQPWPEQRFFLRAFYKDIFRMPTFSEIYLAYMGSLSSYLKPEYARQFNMGVVYSGNIGKNFDIDGQVDVYYNRVRDKILARPGGVNFRWTMKNVGLVKIRGVDVALGASSRIWKDLKLSGKVNYSYQKAQDYTPVEVLSDTISYKGQISYIPRHSGSALFGAGYKTWDLSYSFIYTGKRYTESSNIPENKVLEWYTHDLAISKSFRWDKLQFKATVEVNNLLNQAYDVVKNYPMPGTNFKFIFHLIF